jgi:hypothetical protein
MKYFATAAHPIDIPALAPNGDKWYGAAPYYTGYTWSKEQIDRFAHHFFIVQTPVNVVQYAKHARCIDVERYAVTPEEVAAFCDARNAFRGDATVYCSESSIAEIHAFDPAMNFRLFAADWDGSPQFRPIWGGKLAWAKQYANPVGYEPCVLFADEF